MAETYFPFDSGAGANINEQQWRDLSFALNSIGAGVIVANDNMLLVTADGASGLNVTLGTGRAGCYGHNYQNTAALQLPVTGNGSGGTRVDAVVINFDFSGNTVHAQVVPGGVGTAPALTQNSVSQYQVVVAYILVTVGVANIPGNAVFPCLDRFGGGVAQSLPIGAIVDTALNLSSVPPGFVPCDGASYSKYHVPKLSGVQSGSPLVPTVGGSFTYGLSGTNFVAPDLRERASIGSVDMGSNDLPGTAAGPSNRGTLAGFASAGGEAQHLLTVAELATHHHHADPNAVGANGRFVLMGGAATGTSVGIVAGGTVSHDPATDNTGQTGSPITNDAGSSTAHNNLQPYLTVNKLLKVS